MVVNWRNLNNIHSNQIQIPQGLKYRQNLGGTQSAYHRSPGSRCKGRVQTVNVKCNVNWIVRRDDIVYCVNHSLNSVIMYPGSMQNVEAMSTVILCPNSDLH